VVVVDDASQAARKVSDTAAGHGAHVIRLDANVGFAGAVNRGLGHGRAEYMLVLNSDTEVHAGALDGLVSALESNPRVAAAGPLLLNLDGTVQPQCKRGRLTPLNGLAYAAGLDRIFPGHRFFDAYMRRVDGYECARSVHGLMGSCMLLRRSAVEQVGGLDESMFLYGEDLDLCYRLADADFDLLFLPTARVTHVGGEGGTQVRYLRSQFHYHRSLQLLFRKHPPTRWYPAYGWFVDAGLALRFVAMAVAYGLGRRRIGSPRIAGPVSPATRDRA
jgi:hypothetical protein